jgi:glycosyltransferase involved in cell wall biosynthesis
MVSIAMITYNHVHHITQAIEGVLSQKTSFPFELIIGEDCSIDGTGDLVFSYQNKYPNIIRVITSDRNVGMMRNFCRVTEACKGKYIAFCEGDDYWTDPCKLRKQVDFLEQNPDYAMVHTDSAVLMQGSGKFYKSSNKRLKGLPKEIPSGFIYDFLLMADVVGIGTLTVLARRSVVMDAQREIGLAEASWKMGDYPLWLEIAKHHKIKYIDETTAVYRYLDNSASHSKDKQRNFEFRKDVFDVRFHFIKKYGAAPATVMSLKKDYNEMLLNHVINLNDRKILSNHPLFEDAEVDHKIACLRLGVKYPWLRRFAWIYIRIAYFARIYIRIAYFGIRRLL